MTLAAKLVGDALTPDPELWKPNLETPGVATSLSQARIMVQILRDTCARRRAATTRGWIRLSVSPSGHKESGKLFPVLSSSGRRAKGFLESNTVPHIGRLSFPI